MKRKPGMNQRERLLAIGLGAVVVVYFVGPPLQRYLFDAIAAKRTELAEVQKSVEMKQRQEMMTLFDERRIKSWEARSLPPDPLDAQRVYLAWMTDLVTNLGFESPVVTTSPPVASGDVYSTVAVSIDGEATFDTVVRFLFHARRVNVMHRIAKIDLVSTGRSPSDPLEVSIVTEGFALASAKPRALLFARTQLAEATEASGDVVQVDGAAGFPSKTPFEIRIGGEFARVLEADGDTWTLARGEHGSRATRHGEGEFVELVPVSSDWRDRTLESFRQLADASPFAKPRTYSPSVAPVRDITISMGETAKTKLFVSGYNAALGKPAFELSGDLEQGMKIDANSGSFEWTPAEDAEPGTYPVLVKTSVPGLAEPVDREFSVIIRSPNTAPALAAIQPQRVVQGDEMTFNAEATDEDEGQTLTYSLRDAPRGASIDRSTGEFRWTVPIDYEPGPWEFDVVVSDPRGDSDTKTISVEVVENTIRSTFLVGTVNRDGEREAWLVEQKSGTKTILREGTQSQIGGVDSFVLVIGRNFVLLQRDDRTFRLDLGRPLIELREQFEDEDGGS